ncbi:MAG: 3-ketoacyl-ACP reductase [Notoacmeibacter sp.]|nr:3-ketoacyl-ACP reductase [Notoacmeibacter sp.]MCC0032647.1 3-ketoacyl-ACP reductase [Brucellaceae bacterium]
MSVARKRPVAVVTGGRQGLGRGCAMALAARGFDLVLIDLHDDGTARATVDAAKSAGAGVHFLKGDIADLSSHAALAQAAWDAFGGIDCMVNNAGVAPLQLADVLTLTPHAFDHNLGINLRGNFFLAQAVARLMTEAGAGPFNRSMVFITSIAANHVSVAIPEYCISKSALSMVAGLFALTLAQSGIQVHEVRPGFIRTAMTTEGEGSPTAAIEAHISAGHVPMNRWGEERDVGETVAMLASGGLPFSVAHPVYVDGGYGIRTA